MRRWITAGIVGVVLALGVGCAGRNVQRYESTKGPVYVGMSTDAITEVLGPPETVGEGPYGCRYTTKFFLLTAGDHTVEWSWRDDLARIIAWLEFNRVYKLGVIQETDG